MRRIRVERGVALCDFGNLIYKWRASVNYIPMQAFTTSSISVGKNTILHTANNLEGAKAKVSFV